MLTMITRTVCMSVCVCVWRYRRDSVNQEKIPVSNCVDHHAHLVRSLAKTNVNHEFGVKIDILRECENPMETK